MTTGFIIVNHLQWQVKRARIVYNKNKATTTTTTKVRCFVSWLYRVPWARYNNGETGTAKPLTLQNHYRRSIPSLRKRLLKRAGNVSYPVWFNIDSLDCTSRISALFVIEQTMWQFNKLLPHYKQQWAIWNQLTKMLFHFRDYPFGNSCELDLLLFLDAFKNYYYFSKWYKKSLEFINILIVSCEISCFLWTKKINFAFCLTFRKFPFHCVDI